MIARQAFGVFVESLDDDAHAQWIELPTEPTRIVSRGGQVVAVPLDECLQGLILETVHHERQPYLAMLSRPVDGVRVNGVAAPSAAVLRIRDQVELDGCFLLHVSQFTRPYHGPAAAEHVGRDCPVCLTPIEEGSLIFVCPNCQTALHAQGDETPVADRLECHLSSSTCPCCNLPLVREEGYAYVPQL